MRHLKDTHEAVAGEVLTSLGGFAPEMLLALGARVATRVPQRNVNTVTTNVPGPQRPLFLAGRRMLEAFPYVPLGGHVRVGVAIYSYDGGLGFGVTGDEGTAPDVGVLGDGIEASMRDLLAAAREHARDRERRAGGAPGAATGPAADRAAAREWSGSGGRPRAATPARMRRSARSVAGATDPGGRLRACPPPPRLPLRAFAARRPPTPSTSPASCSTRASAWTSRPWPGGSASRAPPSTAGSARATSS